ncbi:hypothetical protein PPL_10529 [Heterostelium album PN500]|uniref:Uncharacterized protein n=1 Tax=Heterostelium pallidum (strain ATCC 26659 / Pp 5 / PN500) TaxID=670386 RepID=D3BRC1_HETP5|nr:hypothetical protein PPL_10529 [Heterostelium album PN500]EFA75953.1 hypothetical protein PPL_10529 [Heterostelium album PN500]|eukprot:XP_020428087.1 hypothetical protein PPL_10529 [Heterostelium album PN500]
MKCNIKIIIFLIFIFCQHVYCKISLVSNDTGVWMPLKSIEIGDQFSYTATIDKDKNESFRIIYETSKDQSYTTVLSIHSTDQKNQKSMFVWTGQDSLPVVYYYGLTPLNKSIDCNTKNIDLTIKSDTAGSSASSVTYVISLYSQEYLPCSTNPNNNTVTKTPVNPEDSSHVAKETTAATTTTNTNDKNNSIFLLPSFIVVFCSILILNIFI